MLSGFKVYNKSELFEKIDAIDITRIENQIITKYFNVVINTTSVTNRYEIFDIRSFLKEKIDNIQSNFNISFYKFVMKRGTQELTLLSDEVTINNSPYYKAFFILNSTDKSRKLNMNLGLYRGDNNTYLVSSLSNMSFCKKHLKGVTKAAEDSSFSIDGEKFDEQIDLIKSLVGERVLLSNIRSIILDKDLKINHRKFDAFKNQLIYTNLFKEHNSTLRLESEKLVLDSKNDFSIDAYLVFNLYLQIFRNQDSYLVRKETEKIIKITQCFIRNKKLELILE